MRKSPILYLVAMLATATLPGTAFAQADLGALLDRLGRLEQDLNALQRKIYRDGAGVADSSAASAGKSVSSEPLPTDVAGRLEVRMTQIEAEMRGLTGLVERVNHDISTVNSRLDKLVEDVDHRLSMLESGNPGMAPAGSGTGSGQSSSGIPQTAPGSGTLGTLTREQIETQSTAASIQPFVQEVKLPDGPAEVQYDFAFDLLRKKEYDQAASAFTSFVEKNSDHKLAGNAQYWLGETYYARADFERAAIAFAEGYKKYGSSSKAPDNMLKLGMSLAEIGRTDQACTAFSKLAEAYPEASATIRQRAATERRRNNCK